MGAIQSTVMVFFAGLLISGIPMFYQSRTLELEATTDNKKLRLSKQVRKDALILILIGVFGLLVLAIMMALGTLCPN